MKDFEVDINGIIETVQSALRESGLEDIADRVQRATNGIDTAVSGKEVEKAFPVGPHSSLSMSGVRSGDVWISAADEPVIRVRYRSRSSSLNQEEPFVAEQTDNGVELQVKGHGGSIEYRIVVPRDCSVSVHGLSSDIDVAGTNGGVELETASGDVKLEDVTGSITIRTVSGDIIGDRLNGPLQVHTTSGDVSVTESHHSGFDLYSVSGDFSIDTSAPRDARYAVNTTSGDLHLYVPGETGLSVKLNTSSGSVHSHLPVEIIQANKRHWEGNVNGGGAILEMRSSSGDLEIRRSSRLLDVPSTSSSPAATPASQSRPAPVTSVPTAPGTEPTELSTPTNAEPTLADLETGDDSTAPEPSGSSEILAALERGEISVDEAMRRLDEGS